MSDIKQSALELIGKTPLLQLNGYSKVSGIKDATILAKARPSTKASSFSTAIISS